LAGTFQGSAVYRRSVGDSVEDQAPGKGGQGNGTADLSERQYACLVHAGEGMSSKQIGRLLGISPSTVDNHIHVAMTKLQARNRWHAAQLLGPLRQQNGSDHANGAALIPPLGGKPNTSSAFRRLRHIIVITTISIIALTASTVLILGAIDVFQLG
jgi:DNA-binding CsgD family transcriptional regulator